MPHAILPGSSTPERILGELQDAARAGDLPQLQEALGVWDRSVLDMTWFTPTVPERLIQIRHETSRREVALQRAISVAAKGGHCHVVEYLLDERGCAITSPAVSNSLSQEHWDIVELFIDRGWDINTPVQGGNTLPVLRHFLSSEIHVRWLLEHGADPSARSAGRNNDILSEAARFAPVGVLKLLRKHGGDFSQSNALHVAAKSPGSRPPEAMTYLLMEAKVPIDQREYEFDAVYFQANRTMGFGTALHRAVGENRVENIRLLLAMGADPEVRDGKGMTAVEVARASGFHDAVEMLQYTFS